jgi:hypothetical protein
MCDHDYGACYCRRWHSKTFKKLDRILIDETDTNLYERLTKAFVFMSEAERNTGAFIPGTMSGLGSTLPERSRVSGMETRIHTDTGICRL